MAKVAALQSSFNTGEITPLMAGRVDFDKYKTALATCLNHIPLVQGPVVRRPGTTYVASTKTAGAKARLVRFVFSTTQSYILEFGNLYVRFYRTHGQVINGGNPVELVTPYTTADLFDLSFTQSADTLYIGHQKYPPSTITRTSDIAWTFGNIAFLDGPYLAQNATATTFTLGATTIGSTTLVASSVTGINNGLGFQSGDVGRVVRIQVPSQAWAWGSITAVADTTHATINMVSAAGSTSATTVWRLGEWGTYAGYPGCVAFYQDRLCWAGSVLMPQTVHASVTGDYVNHRPTALDTSGTVADNNALSFTLNSSDVQVIFWMSGDANGLLIGTQSGEWSVAPSTLGGALTPTNVNAVQMTSYGMSRVQPARVGYTTLALQRSLRKVRELTFVYYENRYHAPDMTVLAQHITLGGVTQMAFQLEPNSVLWAVRGDGTLLGFTYERDQQVVGWHRHTVGGVSDSSGTAAKVESVAVIPAPDGTRDEVWMIVQRRINGKTVRFVEYMNKIWEDGDTVATSVYADAALSYSGTPVNVITGATHLVGETVGVFVDGAGHPDRVVASDGSVTLNRAGSVVTLGYKFNSDGKTLRNDAGASDGTAQGKTQRTHYMTFRLMDTLGLKVGRDFDHLAMPDIVGRTLADNLGEAVPLFSGDAGFQWEGDYSTNNQICWRFSGMFPGMVQSAMPQQATQDR